MQCIQQSFSCSSVGTMGFQGHSSVPSSVTCLTEFTATRFLKSEKKMHQARLGSLARLGFSVGPGQLLSLAKSLQPRGVPSTALCLMFAPLLGLRVHFLPRSFQAFKNLFLETKAMLGKGMTFLWLCLLDESQIQLQLSRNHMMKSLMVKQKEDPTSVGFILHSLGSDLCLPPLPALACLVLPWRPEVGGFFSFIQAKQGPAHRG